MTDRIGRVGLSKSWKVTAGQLIALIVLLLIQEYVVTKGIISDLFLAAPSQIVTEFVESLAENILLPNIWVTLGEFVVGFIVSILLGVGCGVVLATSHSLEEFFKPFLSALMAIPKVTIMPLLMIWFGLGYGSKVLFVLISGFFPILFNTIAGVKQTSNNHLKVARVFEASRSQIIIKVLLPSAMPTIFAGIRVAAASGLMGAIFSEIMGSRIGLGNLLTKSSQMYQTGQLFMLIIVITLMAVLTIQLIDWLERKVFLKWKTR